MAKAVVGQKLPDFSFATPFEEVRRLSETVGRVQGKTALVFLRYFGCPLCQLDIRRFQREYEKIRAADGQLLVVLQSSAQNLRQQLTPDSLPFDIICDPEQRLYTEFQIPTAASSAKMMDFKSAAKFAIATASGIKHGEYEGEELQLPAAFVVDKKQNLTFVHYGTAAGDVPTPNQLARMLSSPSI